MTSEIIGFADAIEAWRTTKSARGGWSPASQYYVGLSIKAWEPVLKNTPLDRINGDLIRRLSLALSSTRSVSWCKQSRSFLFQAWRWFQAMGWVEHDPLRVWPAPRGRRKRARLSLSLEQAELLADVLIRIAVSRGKELARLVRFAWFTGMRTGTLRKLMWSMVLDEPEGAELVIPGEIMKMDNDLRIPLCAAGRAALGPRGEGLVFPWLPSAQTLHYYFKRAAAEEPRIPETISPHQLRKSFAYEHVVRRRTPIPVVAALGGWRSVSVLMKEYVGEIRGDVLRAAVEGVRAV